MPSPGTSRAATAVTTRWPGREAVDDRSPVSMGSPRPSMSAGGSIASTREDRTVGSPLSTECGEYGGQLAAGVEEVQCLYAACAGVGQCIESRTAAWRSKPAVGASSVPMSAIPTSAAVGRRGLVPLDRPVDVATRLTRAGTGVIMSVPSRQWSISAAAASRQSSSTPVFSGREPDLEGVGEVLRGGVGHQVAPGVGVLARRWGGLGLGALGALALGALSALSGSASGEASAPCSISGRGPRPRGWGRRSWAAITASLVNRDDALRLDHDGGPAPARCSRPARPTPTARRPGGCLGLKFSNALGRRS